MQIEGEGFTVTSCSLRGPRAAHEQGALCSRGITQEMTRSLRKKKNPAGLKKEEAALLSFSLKFFFTQKTKRKSSRCPRSSSLQHPPLLRGRRGGSGGAGGGVRADGGGGGRRQLGSLERLRVDDDLDDKVLLDLGVLQPCLVGEQLPGEEPALVGGVDVVLHLQLLLQQPDGVGHAGAEPQVLPGGQSYLAGTDCGRGRGCQVDVTTLAAVTVNGPVIVTSIQG